MACAEGPFLGDIAFITMVAGLLILVLTVLRSYWSKSESGLLGSLPLSNLFPAHLRWTLVTPTPITRPLGTKPPAYHTGILTNRTRELPNALSLKPPALQTFTLLWCPTILLLITTLFLTRKTQMFVRSRRARHLSPPLVLIPLTEN